MIYFCLRLWLCQNKVGETKIDRKINRHPFPVFLELKYTGRCVSSLGFNALPNPPALLESRKEYSVGNTYLALQFQINEVGVSQKNQIRDGLKNRTGLISKSKWCKSCVFSDYFCANHARFSKDQIRKLRGDRKCP